jgi:hypothetical protein
MRLIKTREYVILCGSEVPGPPLIIPIAGMGGLFGGSGPDILTDATSKVRPAGGGLCAKIEQARIAIGPARAFRARLCMLASIEILDRSKSHLVDSTGNGYARF